MLSSSTPYDIQKTEDGKIQLTLETKQFQNHADIEGYGDITGSIGMTLNTRNAIIQQIVDDLKQGTPFVRFKSELASLPTASFTTHLVLLITVWSFFQLFVIPLGFGINFTSELWEAMFVLSSENIDYVWTWVTNIFSHGGLIHLLVNSIAIISFGYVVEEEIKKWRIAILFFVTAILASLIQVFVVAQFSTETIRVLGASGGAAALVGCASVFYPNMRIGLFFIIPMKLWKAVVIFVVGSTAVVAVYGFGAWNVAHTAHIFGFLSGVGYGLYRRKFVGIVETMYDIKEYT